MATTYRLRCMLSGHEKDVRALAPCRAPPGGIISGSRDLTSRVWMPNDFDNGFTEGSLMRGHANYVAAICTLPESDAYPNGLIVTGSFDSTINVYSLDSPVPLYTLRDHTEAVCGLASGLHGTLLSASWDKTAKVWMKNRLLMTLEGHTMAVWTVAFLPAKGMMITGSADKTLRLWLNGTCTEILKGHEDCVRSLTVLSCGSVVSASNDGTLRLWIIGDRQNSTCLTVFYGHTNYIYSVTAMPEGCLGDFASVSEDRTLRIWKKDRTAPLQTIFHPAMSVWAVCSLANGDLVTGSSDATLRVFTADPQRAATDEEVRDYEKVVASTAIPQQIGDLKPDSLPGPESLAMKGPSDGFVKMIREGTSITCYQWCESVQQWQKIGDVVGSSGATAATSGKTLYNGKEYDYVFVIDAKEGAPPLKLPYNLTEDPWWAAQKFIDANQLSQMFLDQIANFIIENTKATVLTEVSPGASSDPFTGSGRYVPGSGSAQESSYNRSTREMAGSDPFTGGSRYSPAGSQARAAPLSEAAAATPNVQKNMPPSDAGFPQLEFVTFSQANVSAIVGKLKELGAAASPVLSDADCQSLESVASSGGSSAQLDLLWRLIIQWPKEKIFPLLDILRLALKSSAANEYFYSGARATATLEYLLTLAGDGSTSLTNQMLALRALCNSFSQPAGRCLLAAQANRVIDACTSRTAMSVENKNVQVAACTLLLNYAVLVGVGPVSQAVASEAADRQRQLVLNATAAYIRHQSGCTQDGEAQFRLLVCIGTLIWDSAIGTAMAASVPEVNSFVKMCSSQSDVAGKVLNCARPLARLLAASND